METAAIRTLAESLGVDLFGVADLHRAHEFIIQQGGEVVASFSRAISVGIFLFHPIVDLLPDRFEKSSALLYRHQCYDQINFRLDAIISRLASSLQKEGWRVLPIPASQTVDTQRLMGTISHKLAARLAGLGWIGKNCLLITPQVGPRLRLATLLTNAPLEAIDAPLQEGCGACQACVEICPAQAISGRSFSEDEPRHQRIDAHKCEAYIQQMEKTIGVQVCGMCLYACPYGRRTARNG